MLKAIILSIDGIITDLSHFHFLAWKSIYSLQGIEFNAKDWQHLKGLSRSDVVKSFNQKSKTNLTLDQMNKIFDDKNLLFIKLIKEGLKPSHLINGAKQLIDEAKNKGLKVIIISQSSNALLEIKSLGLAKKVDYVTNLHAKGLQALSDDEKEHFSTIQYAFKELGLVGHECIGFGNRIGTINQYKAYGVYTVGIANYENEREIKKIADYSVDMPEQVNFDEIVFNYYIQDDKKSN
ncbi:beta-phosphoglucomutase [Bacilli bacterium]|nr:beta-phosphoglucomutase [Bacilli bacterium]